MLPQPSLWTLGLLWALGLPLAGSSGVWVTALLLTVSAPTFPTLDPAALSGDSLSSRISSLQPPHSVHPQELLQATPYTWGCGDGLWELALSFHFVRPEAQSRVVRLGGGCLHPLCLLAGPCSGLQLALSNFIPQTTAYYLTWDIPISQMAQLIRTVKHTSRFFLFSSPTSPPTPAVSLNSP